MEYDELKHFEKLLDEFEEDALAAATSNTVPSAGKQAQRDITRRNVLLFVENVVLQRDHLVDELNVPPKGAVATVVPTTP